MFIVYHELISHITNKIYDEDEAMRDTKALSVMIGWALIDEEIKASDPTVEEKTGAVVFTSRFYHALSRTVWCEGGIFEQIKQGEINPFAAVDLMEQEEENDTVQLQEVERQIKLGYLPLTANPLTWGHILIAFMHLLYNGYDTVVLRGQGEIGYKEVAERDYAPVDIRHETLRAVVEKFYPLIRYTDLGVDNDLEGAEQIADLFNLKNNPRRRMHVFHILGVETVKRSTKYIRMTHRAIAEAADKFGINPNHERTLAFNQRGEDLPLEKLRGIDGQVAEELNRPQINISLLEDPDVDLQVASTSYRMIHDTALVPVIVHELAVDNGLYNHPPRISRNVNFYRRLLQVSLTINLVLFVAWAGSLFGIIIPNYTYNSPSFYFILWLVAGAVVLTARYLNKKIQATAAIDKDEHVRKQLQPVSQSIAERIAKEARAGKKVIFVSIDGGSGTGKTSIANYIIDEARKLSDLSGYDFLNVGLDLFLRERSWRIAMQKLIAGQPLSEQETELSVNGVSIRELSSRIVSGQEYLDEETFFDQERILELIREIIRFRDDPDAEEKVLVLEDVYIRREKRRGEEELQLSKPMVVVIDGKYANREELVSYYDLAFRLKDHPDRAMIKFEKRTRGLYPQDANISMYFYHLGLVPSYEEYAARTAGSVDGVIDITNGGSWRVDFSANGRYPRSVRVADSARPLPEEPIPSRSRTKKAVETAGWDNLDIVGPESEEMKMALSYLRKVNPHMAEYLKYIAREGLVRAGPVEGFLATVYGEEAIVLSTAYQEYDTTLERAASLVHEIGAVSEFNLCHVRNSVREKEFRGWVNLRAVFIRKCERQQVLEQQGLDVQVVRRLTGESYRHCSEFDFLRAILVSLGIQDCIEVGLDRKDLAVFSSSDSVKEIPGQVKSGDGCAVAFSGDLSPEILVRLQNSFRIIGYRGFVGDSYIDLRNKQAEITGIFLPLEQALKDGEQHSDVYVFVFSPEGKVLMQTRSEAKKVYPLKREASASGHVRAGQSTDEAALSIMHKELGVKAKADNLILMGAENRLIREADFSEVEVHERGFITVYVYILGETDRIMFDPHEVDGVEFTALEDELENLRRHPEEYAGIRQVLEDRSLVRDLIQVSKEIHDYRLAVIGKTKTTEIVFRLINRFSADRVKTVAYVTPEATPFKKTGGLGDVSGELPQTVNALGVEQYLFTVGYDDIIAEGDKEDTGLAFNMTINQEEIKVKIWHKAYKNVDYFFLSTDSGYSRVPYEGDQLHLAIFLSEGTLRAIELLVGAGIVVNPQVIHANDWQAGLIPLYIKVKYNEHPLFKRTATVFSLHNQKYRADWIPSDRYPELGISGEHWWGIVQPESSHHFSIVRAAIFHCDKWNTVSKTNRDELMTPEYGEGLVDDFRDRSADGVGIINGVDYEKWSPIPPQDRPIEKARLQSNLGLTVDQEIMLIGMVSRIAEQKNVQMVIRVIKELVLLSEGKIQFVFLGKGNPDDPYSHQTVELMEEMAADAQLKDKVRFIHEYTTKLQRLVFGGIDLFLYPSVYEPCGTKPIVALINGVPCVVRKTGGLADNVEEFDPETGVGNGFVFVENEDSELRKAILRAVALFEDKELWSQLEANARSEDRSWTLPAIEYVKLYRYAIEKKQRNLSATPKDSARPLPGESMPDFAEVRAEVSPLWDTDEVTILG
ncbi:MAG: glycosyltransferase, partial [Candidatus Omnitrophica bacterium]|nr:glycosyltransferase [Candidatus Omnitrophota bacterium]